MTLPNGQPTPQPGTTPEGQAPATTPEGQPGTSPQKPYTTVEEADAFWTNRMSGRDRAHNAAEQTLREENERLQRELAARGAPSAGQSGAPASESDDARQWRLKAEAAERRAQETEAAAALSERKAKYPSLVAQGVSDDIFKTTDEASLAKLNALADDRMSGGTFIAPTSPGRAAPAPAKPLGEMTKDELTEELRKNVAAGGHLPRG